jgi:hypothetical protein
MTWCFFSLRVLCLLHVKKAAEVLCSSAKDLEKHRLTANHLLPKERRLKFMGPISLADPVLVVALFRWNNPV